MWGWPIDSTRVGAIFADDPLNRENILPLTIGPPIWGGHRGLVVGVFDCGPTGRWF